MIIPTSIQRQLKTRNLNRRDHATNINSMVSINTRLNIIDNILTNIATLDVELIIRQHNPGDRQTQIGIQLLILWQDIIKSAEQLMELEDSHWSVEYILKIQEHIIAIKVEEHPKKKKNLTNIQIENLYKMKIIKKISTIKRLSSKLEDKTGIQDDA